MAKILQLAKQYPPFKGGVELVSQMISRAYHDLGDKVSIISFGEGNYNYSGDFGEEVIQINRDIFIKSAPISLSLVFNFMKIIEKIKPQKIYVHLPNPYMHHLVYFFRRQLDRRGIKIAGVYHSDLANQKLIAPIYNSYFIKTASFYDEMICSSENLWNSSPVLTKLCQTKRRVIPFCVDSDVAFRQRRKFEGKLLSIGRMVPYKGFDFLVDALDQTKYQLTIIGDGPNRVKLSKQSSDNINFVGQVSEAEKSRLLNESDLLVIPSINRAEAYGMVIVEAFKAGLPVIASDINTGVTFLVKDEVRGKTFKIRSKEELLASIRRFEDDPHFFCQCSISAREFYENELTYETFRSNVANLK